LVEYTLDDIFHRGRPSRGGVAYLFDVDVIERSAYPQFPKLPNHALMKFSSYFKGLGLTVKLVWRPEQVPLLRKDNAVYVGSALYTGNHSRFIERLQLRPQFNLSLRPEDITIGTPRDFMPSEVEDCLCDYTEYIQAVSEGLKLGWWPVNVGFLTRGCFRRCEFCVNRDKTEIYPVNTLEEIYRMPGHDIELLDDNLFPYKGAPDLLREIGDFHRREGVGFRLRNGLDCRRVTDDRLEALAYAAPGFKAFHTAWDDVKNTFIYTNILKVYSAINRPLRCYTLAGVYVETEEDAYKDILGLFYRYYMLRYTGVEPIIALFEDDRGEYRNPYWHAYMAIKRSYYMMRASRRTHLRRWAIPGTEHITDWIINLLGDYSWLAELRLGDILDMPDLDSRLEEIAGEIGVKHRGLPDEPLRRPIDGEG